LFKAANQAKIHDFPQIGAGVLGGAALLAGGVFAYKKHEEHKEEV